MMRNFDERKQEILRRAEEKICRRKKRRKQLLGIGIPLAGLIVCLALLLPAGTAARKHTAFQEFAMDAAPTMPEIPENTTAVNSQIFTDDLPAEAAAADAPPMAEPAARFHVIGSGDSDVEGIWLRLQYIPEDASFIEVLWVNETEHPAEFLDSYYILRWDESHSMWISCAEGTCHWSGEPFCLDAYQMEVPMTYRSNLENFDLSLAGQYQIVGEFRLLGDDQVYTAWSGFEIRRDEGEYTPNSPLEPTSAVEAPREITVGEVGDFGSDYPGVYLEFSNVDLEQRILMSFWRNETNVTAYITQWYDLQRLVDDQWVSCAAEKLAFDHTAYALSPHLSIWFMDYRIQDVYFDLSSPGTYRLLAQFRMEADETPYTAWAEFTLEEGE